MSVFDWKRHTLRVERDAILPPAEAHTSPRGYRRIYLLVHGFNNTPDKANESYNALRRRIEGEIGPQRSKKIWEFYWPGYEEGYRGVMSLRTGVRPANFMVTAYFYHRQVPKAVRFGKLLGDYILKLQAETQETEVVFIGHSLGCRVILEALAQIQGHTSSAKVPAILLMAAAVPVSAVQSGGDLRPAVESCERRFALFSHRDLVLSVTFPIGQTRAQDGGSMPEAVGWRGAPEDKCWTGRQRVQLTHGEYWEDDVTTPNIVRLFGKATAHELPYSTIVPWRLRNPPPLPQRETLKRNSSDRINR
jgi:hypothetical protein